MTGRFFRFAVPDKEFRILSLGTGSKLSDKAIAAAEILGSKDKVAWTQQADALVVAKPAVIPHKEAVGIKITFKD